MKVCVCNLTIGKEYYDTVSLGIDSIKKYCEFNNYHFYFESEYIDDTRHIYWNKILLIQKCLRKGYDYVVWLDSDILIMRMDILLEDIITQYMGDKDFLIACDPEMINTGVWFCKNNKFVDDVLTETYLQKQFDGTRMPEQSAFEKVISNRLEHIKILYFPESYLINATIYTLKKESFLVHFMGVHTAERMIQLMNDHYPFPKHNENQWVYYDRINWLNEKYGLNLPSMKIGVITTLSGKDYIDKVKLGTNTKEEYCKSNSHFCFSSLYFILAICSSRFLSSSLFFFMRISLTFLKSFIILLNDSFSFLYNSLILSISLYASSFSFDKSSICS